MSALQKGSFEAKCGRENGLSQTPISLVLSAWELEKRREKKTNHENEEFQYRKFSKRRKRGVVISKVAASLLVAQTTQRH